MSSFYNSSSQGAGGGNGFYNSGGGGYDYSTTHQFQQQSQEQQPQQQQGTTTPAYNVNQWQGSSQQGHNSTNSGSMQQQQQQSTKPGASSATPAFWNPGAAAAMVGMAAQAAASGGMSNENMLDWAAKQAGGSQVWQSGGASMIPGFDRAMQTLRAYFAVDNRYVQLKMQKVLFPFMSRQWKRMQTEGPDRINFALPNSDENAPDLYLPSMSLITYCLLCSLLYGTAGEFNPEVIADVTTKCFVTQVLEVLVIRFGFYMMQARIPLLDLFSYTGYKYLGLTVNILCGMTAGQLGYGTSGFYVTFLWTASASSYFMLKTMANNIPTETAATGPKREVMVLAFAASQAVSMWFVSQTKFL